MKVYTLRLDKIIPDLEYETIELNYNTRKKYHFQATLKNGRAISAYLTETGISLHSGSFIATEQGDILRIEAKPERLMKVVSKNSFDLLTAAYHLGQQRVTLMLTPTALYFEPDHICAKMVIALGLMVTEVEHPFEPEKELPTNSVAIKLA